MYLLIFCFFRIAILLVNEHYCGSWIDFSFSIFNRKSCRCHVNYNVPVFLSSCCNFHHLYLTSTVWPLFGQCFCVCVLLLLHSSFLFPFLWFEAHNNIGSFIICITQFFFAPGSFHADTIEPFIKYFIAWMFIDVVLPFFWSWNIKT